MTWQNERAVRKEIVEIHHRLYDLGFSVANDGNTSVLTESGRILITPRGLTKAKLTPDDIVTIDLEGKNLDVGSNPSSEISIHLGIYKTRPDVRAIIHAHPPYAIALSLASVSLEENLLPELILSLGQIPTTPYVTPATAEAGQIVSEKMRTCDALIMDRHGTVTVGTTLEEAMIKLERIEHAAKIVAIGRSMGAVTPLPKPEVDRLIQMTEVPAVAKKPELDSAFIELVAAQVAAELKLQKR
ncbi:MAG: class II aldolase/adducin family protein [Pseudomonadota bacterium]